MAPTPSTAKSAELQAFAASLKAPQNLPKIPALADLCAPDGTALAAFSDHLRVVAAFTTAYRSANCAAELMLEAGAQEALLAHVEQCVLVGVNMNVGKQQISLKTLILSAVGDIIGTPADRLPSVVGSIIHSGLIHDAPKGGEATGKTPKSTAAKWQGWLERKPCYYPTDDVVSTIAKLVHADLSTDLPVPVVEVEAPATQDSTEDTSMTPKNGGDEAQGEDEEDMEVQEKEESTPQLPVKLAFFDLMDCKSPEEAKTEGCFVLEMMDAASGDEKKAEIGVKGGRGEADKLILNQMKADLESGKGVRVFLGQIVGGEQEEDILAGYVICG